MLPVQTQEKYRLHGKANLINQNEIQTQSLDSANLAGPTLCFRALEMHTKYLYRERGLCFCHKLRSVSHEILAAEAVAESKATGKHLCGLQTH